MRSVTLSAPGRPFQGPVCLLLDAVKVVNGMEQAVLLRRVLDVRVNHEAVHLAVDVLDGDLKAVEGASLQRSGASACVLQMCLALPVAEL